MDKYKDIIDIKRPVSSRLKKMKQIDRAAQFAPFAALTGHKEAVKEKEKVLCHKKLLDENKKEVINNTLQIIDSKIKVKPSIKLTYFVQELHEEIGTYHTVITNIAKIDKYNRQIILTDLTMINIEDIYELEIID